MTNFNIFNINCDIIPKQFLNYINYELRVFEQITDRKFLMEISTDKLELKVSKQTENNNKLRLQDRCLKKLLRTLPEPGMHLQYPELPCQLYRKLLS